MYSLVDNYIFDLDKIFRINPSIINTFILKLYFVYITDFKSSNLILANRNDCDYMNIFNLGITYDESETDIEYVIESYLDNIVLILFRFFIDHFYITLCHLFLRIFYIDKHLTKDLYDKYGLYNCIILLIYYNIKHISSDRQKILDNLNKVSIILDSFPNTFKLNAIKLYHLDINNNIELIFYKLDKYFNIFNIQTLDKTIKLKISNINYSTTLSWLIYYCFNNNIPSNNLDWIKNIKPSTLDINIIDIACNVGTTKDIIPSILTELIQNSIDIINKNNSSNRQIFINTINYESNYILEFKDMENINIGSIV